MVSDALTKGIADPTSLNPCCSGIWSRTRLNYRQRLIMRLNPCCSGIWSRTSVIYWDNDTKQVLILVVVEYGLGLQNGKSNQHHSSLNPCCSGIWSRTLYDYEKVRFGVLILVVVEYGLGQKKWKLLMLMIVLILVVVEYGLGLSNDKHRQA